MRVLILGDTFELSLMEMLKHYLARRGFQVVLDPHSPDAVLEEIELAQHVIVLWSENSSEGSVLYDMALVAARGRKLVVVKHDEVDPFPSEIRRVSITGAKEGRDDQWLLDLSDALRDDLSPVATLRADVSSIEEKTVRFKKLPPPKSPATASAFTPRTLRRGTPELIRVVVHQPRDLAQVTKAARRADPRARVVPQSMPLGDLEHGVQIGISVQARGAQVDQVTQRQTWRGRPLEFCFSAEAEASGKQVVLLIRLYVGDAEVGTIGFVRRATGVTSRARSGYDRLPLKRHQRVFLSYASQDRETVAAIAYAYRYAGVKIFWDRMSLAPGEEWSPRLRREIERCDLFHLCWSRFAAASSWVEWEACFAIARQERTFGSRPRITVQMLDGPPWAKHPESLAKLNFDDFVRAAIVGYARGDGSAQPLQ